MDKDESLLKVEDLKVRTDDANQGTGWPVDGISFDIGKGKIVGLTGESGAGKTTLAYSVLRLIGNAKTGSPDPQRNVSSLGHTVSQRQIVGGKVLYKGQDLLSLSNEALTQIRGREISMIFQNPVSAMHPLMTIGFQIGEPKELHDKLKWEKIRKIVCDYLGKVEVADGKLRYHHDPHMFSGGEGQRIMIAMALICSPSLLIADEPTSSLDLIVQKQVLGLLKAMKEEFDLSVLYISHDFGVVFEMSDDVAIMYAGKIVEYGSAKGIYENPKHPYTRGLKDAYPAFNEPRRRLKAIRGTPPSIFDKSSGCKFCPRCEHARPICSEREPLPSEIESGHFVSCFRASEIH